MVAAGAGLPAVRASPTFDRELTTGVLAILLPQAVNMTPINTINRTGYRRICLKRYTSGRTTSVRCITSGRVFLLIVSRFGIRSTLIAKLAVPQKKSLRIPRRQPSDNGAVLRAIGIGGAVTRSPLPHHRTCGSAYGGSDELSYRSNKRGSPSVSK